MRSLFLALCLSLSLQTQVKPERPPILKGVHTIALLGDDVLEYGDHHNGCVWFLRRYLEALYGPGEAGGIGIINLASAHKTSDLIADSFAKSTLDLKPDIIILNTGMSDVWEAYTHTSSVNTVYGNPLPHYRSDVETIIQQTQKAHLKLIVVSPILINEDLTSKQNIKLGTYISACRDLCTKYHVVFVDLNQLFRDYLSAHPIKSNNATNQLTEDGRHLNRLGNKFVTQALLKALGVSSADQAFAMKQDAALSSESEGADTKPQ